MSLEYRSGETTIHKQSEAFYSEKKAECESDKSRRCKPCTSSADRPGSSETRLPAGAGRNIALIFDAVLLLVFSVTYYNSLTPHTLTTFTQPQQIKLSKPP